MFAGANISNMIIFLIYKNGFFLLRTIFVFNLMFYFNNKLKITKISYILFIYICFVFKIILILYIELKFNSIVILTFLILYIK